jgi:hypothetical protein
MLNVDKLERLDIEEKITVPGEEKSDYDEILSSKDQIIIIKKFNSTKDLAVKWKETVHFTAGYIQNKLSLLGFKDEVAWDIYIVFIIDFDLNPALVSEIEKDKYCCKKYVIDSRDFPEVKDAISSKIALFSNFKLDATNDTMNFNDSQIKMKITEEDFSITANIFKGIDFIDNNSRCDELLTKLKELYINEQTKNNRV